MGRLLTLAFTTRLRRGVLRRNIPRGVVMAKKLRTPDAGVSARLHTGRLHRAAILLRERDWIGIAIELAIVTVGILLAFQIDQWGQDRRQAHEERQFLERMWRETALAIRENDWAIRLHAASRRGGVDGLRSTNDPAALIRLAGISQRGCGLTSFPGLGFNDTTYEELSSSGRLNLVSDPQLRDDLREVAAAQADAVTQLNYSRSLGTAIFEVLQPYYVLDFDADANPTCRTDWPRVVKDQSARNAVVRAARLHVLMWQKRAYARDVLAKAHNRIACKLAKPDCKLKVPQIIGYRPMNDTLPPDLSRKAMGAPSN